MELAAPAALDPLLFSVDLPLRKTYYPHGFPVTIVTNSGEVVEAAEESWADGSPRFPEPPIEVRVTVAEAEPGGLPDAPVFRGLGHLVAIVSDARNFAVWDREKQFAALCLSSRVAQERDWLRFHFLEAVVYVALAQLYLTPLHAACVAHRGNGVLLCGGPGAGKSSLAYACARRGWTYVADDASSLVRGRGDRLVLGRPGQIRFRQDADRLFPELAGRLARRRANGKIAIEVRTAELGNIATAYESRADYIVFLNRPSRSPAGAKPVERERALERILRAMPLLGESVRREQEASVGALLAAEAFELEYTDLGPAIDCLEELIERRG